MAAAPLAASAAPGVGRTPIVPDVSTRAARRLIGAAAAGRNSPRRRLFGLVVTDLTAAAPAPLWTLLDDADPSPLLEPADIAGLHLRNRLVMAPMTRQFSPGGIPGEDVAAYYRRRASSLGLLITEGTYVDHRSAGSSDRVPRFFGAEALAAWRKVAGAVHAEGAAILPELWHLGASASPARRRFPTPRWSAHRA